MENKELEVFKEFKNILLENIVLLDTDLQRLNIIEKALTTKSKKEQAFDIIKGKDVDIYIFTSCKTLNEYNSSVVYMVGEPRELTQEEYDLLNEVLKK